MNVSDVGEIVAVTNNTILPAAKAIGFLFGARRVRELVQEQRDKRLSNLHVRVKTIFGVRRSKFAIIKSNFCYH